MQYALHSFNTDRRREGVQNDNDWVQYCQMHTINTWITKNNRDIKLIGGKKIII